VPHIPQGTDGAVTGRVATRVRAAYWRYSFPCPPRSLKSLSHNSRNKTGISRSLEGHEIYFRIRVRCLRFRISDVGRPRKNPAQSRWRDKLYPVFFEIADLTQEMEGRWARLQNECRQGLKVTGPAASPKVRNEIVSRFREGTAELERWYDEKLGDINRRYTPIPYNPLAYSYFTLDSPISDSEGFRQYLHFHRHGESVEVTKAKDAQGDIEAFDKITRTERDFRILAFGKGAIRPFQEDPVHRQLMQLVICYESERLTADELAECFDKYCACGKGGHEADSLRKMRDRFETELKSSMKSS
jgi:hypothetical protein